MKTVTVSVDVSTPRERVYEYLGVMANHEQFTDHFMVDWELSRPERGVGATASVRVKAPGEKERTEIVVVDAEPGRRTVEEGTGAGGRRRTRGTYTLEDLPGGGTRINFSLELLELPARERLMGPLQRAYLKRVNGMALRRLAERLNASSSAD